MFTKPQILKAAAVVVSMILSAVIGWQVSYQLSHVKPAIFIENIEFFYDFPDKADEGFEKTLIKIPDELYLLSTHAWFKFNLSPITPLINLEHLTYEDLPLMIERTYQTYKQDMKLMLSLLKKENPSPEAIADLILTILWEGFEGTFALLWFMEEKGLNSIPDVNYNEILAKYWSEAGLKLAENRYIIENYLQGTLFEGVERTLHSLMLPHSLNIISYFVTGKYNELINYFQTCLEAIEELRRKDNDIFIQVTDLISKNIKFYKKIAISVQILNKSDFPLSFDTISEIKLADSYRDKIFLFESVLKTPPGKNDKSNFYDESYEPRKRVYHANLLDPKSTVVFLLESIEAIKEDDEKINNLHKAGSLEAKVKLTLNKTGIFQSRKVESDWVRIPYKKANKQN